MPPITITNLRGGRNGIDSPIDPTFPENQYVEGRNVDFDSSSCGETRGGSDNFSTVGGAAFGNGIRFLCSHVPAGDETLRELWGVDGNGVVKRYSGGAWAAITLADPLTGSASEICAVTLNGKLFIFYKSGVSRSHCYDPETGTVRRVGLAAHAAGPTVANTGGGAYASTLRYYRTRSIQLDAATGTRLIRRSEPSAASAAFTPSGAGAAARVTRPTAVGESETHWEVEGSTDALTWVLIRGFGATGTGTGAAIAIATTTYDDTALTTNYGTMQASDELGFYTLFPSMKFATTDGNRLIGAGSYETAEFRQSRVWVSPVLGPGKAEDERWVNTQTLKTAYDLGESNGGNVTGISETIDRRFWVGKYRQLWVFNPTGNSDNPYLTGQIRTKVGFLSHWAQFAAEDMAGNGVIIFVTYKGFYWASQNGVEFIGRDVEDIWRGLKGNSAVNLSATISVCHGVYHSDKSQAYIWISMGANNSPNLRLRLAVKEMVRRDRYGVRGGWHVDDGDAASAYCSCMFANTTGATVSKDLKPWIGRSDTTLYKCDSTSQTDNGTKFQSYLRTRSIVPVVQLGRAFSMSDPLVVAPATQGAFIQVKVLGDFGKTSVPGDVDLSPKKSETSVIRKVGGDFASEAGAIQLEYGDSQAIASTWSVDAILVPLGDEGTK